MPVPSDLLIFKPFTMPRVAVLALCLAASAHAFMAPPQAARPAAVRTAVPGLVGDMAPLGFFDPLGFSKDKTAAQMTKYREAELKHGRQAMVACAGFMVQPWFHPLAKACHITTTADPLASLKELPPAGAFQILVFIGFLEFLSIKIKENDSYAAGDLLGASELTDNSDEGWVDFQQRELANGRLAMMAIAGFVFQDLVFHNQGDMLFAPLRAAYEPGM